MNVSNIQILENAKKYVRLLDVSRWKKFEFWEKMFLYFCFASVLGKIFEIYFWHMQSATIIPYAQPYGLGVVAVIMFVSPLIQKKRTNPFIVFVLNTVISAIVEYLCAVVVVWIYGVNIFWDYSSRIFNLNGYVCFEAAALFGLLATVFIYIIYPLSEKIYKSQRNIIIHTAFIISFGLVVFDTINSIILR